MGLSRSLFLYFRLFKTVDSNGQYKFLPMTGFEPQTSISEATALPTEPQPLPRVFFLLQRILIIHLPYDYDDFLTSKSVAFESPDPAIRGKIAN